MKKLIILTFILLPFSFFAQVSQQWVQIYNGSGNGSDQAAGVVVDNSGNVYVTGRSVGSGTSFDYLTVKYNSTGVQQWTVRYNGPENSSDEATAIAVDIAGNVYVTGQSNSMGAIGAYWADYLTIKYSSNGDQLWTQRYNGPANAGDGATALAIDGSGNVYVTGLSCLSGTNNFDYATIKYNSSGGEQWVSRYSGPGTVSEARSVAVDNFGNVYVTGKSSGSGTFNDYATVKYSSGGSELWARRYNGPGNNYDEANALAIDNSGNVYVTGRSFTSGTGYDYATIKYNASGTEQWNVKYNGSANGEDNAKAITVDESGNVYITGGSANAVGSDYATIKYNLSGAQQWVQRYAGGLAYAITLDGSGNVYITGTSTGNGTGSDYATIKYNALGSQQWAQRYTGPGNNSDLANSIVVDGSGNVYVTGYSRESNDDYATIKYSPGNLVTVNLNNNGLNKPIVDNQNTFDTITLTNDLSSGYIYDVNLKIDTVIHSNDADLEISLIHAGITDTVVYQLGGSGDNFIGTILDDSAATNISGGIAPFTGLFKPVKPLSQFINLDPAGSWILRVFDRAAGNTGTLKAWGLTISVSATPIGIYNISNESPKQFSLSQNYPNPFNPVTKIKFELPNSNLTLSGAKGLIVKLIIYDILGREVETLVNEQLKPGVYEIEWNASNYSSGIYFYKVTSGNYSETKKMILIK